MHIFLLVPITQHSHLYDHKDCVFTAPYVVGSTNIPDTPLTYSLPFKSVAALAISVIS